jgi:hypothetical protein
MSSLSTHPEPNDRRPRVTFPNNFSRRHSTTSVTKQSQLEPRASITTPPGRHKRRQMKQTSYISYSGRGRHKENAWKMKKRFENDGMGRGEMGKQERSGLRITHQYRRRQDLSGFSCD